MRTCFFVRIRIRPKWQFKRFFRKFLNPKYYFLNTKRLMRIRIRISLMWIRLISFICCGFTPACCLDADPGSQNDADPQNWLAGCV
jgi:hypothetical protein